MGKPQSMYLSLNICNYMKLIIMLKITMIPIRKLQATEDNDRKGSFDRFMC